MGKLIAERRPVCAKTLERPKLRSCVRSAIKIGFRLVHTRPGRPEPGAKLVSRAEAMNSGASNDDACHRYAHLSMPLLRFSVQRSPTSQPMDSQISCRILGAASFRVAESNKTFVTAV